MSSSSAAGVRHKLTSASAADLAKVHDLLNANSKFMLVVMADWCGHCVRLKNGPWQEFVASPAARKLHIVELDYDAYTKVAQNDKLGDCVFAKLLKKSVQSFPYVAMVQQTPEAVNVKMYDGAYPVNAVELHKFAGTKN